MNLNAVITWLENGCDVQDAIKELKMMEAAAVKESLTPQGLEVVAWRTFDGEGGYDYRTFYENEEYQSEYINRNGAKYAAWVDPLVTRASAEAAIQAEGLAYETHYEGALDRITALESALGVAREAITSLSGVGHVISWKGEWELCHEAIALIDTTLEEKP